MRERGDDWLATAKRRTMTRGWKPPRPPQFTMVSSSMERSRLAQPTAAYQGLMAGLVLFLALTLFTLVDFRRGFLLAEYPARTFFYVFNPLHALMLATGILGMAACYRGL